MEERENALQQKPSIKMQNKQKQNRPKIDSNSILIRQMAGSCQHNLDRGALTCQREPAIQDLSGGS